jgi:hypothetical protein
MRTKRKELPKTKRSLIDRMAKIRVRNNDKWMELLAIAVREAPRESGRVINHIQKYDNRIGKIWTHLAK